LIVLIMMVMCSGKVWCCTALANSMSMVGVCKVWLVVMVLSYMDVKVVSMWYKMRVCVAECT
jgi:hypothetical protein